MIGREFSCQDAASWVGRSCCANTAATWDGRRGALRPWRKTLRLGVIHCCRVALLIATGTFFAQEGWAVSWGDLKFTVVDSMANGCTFQRVLCDSGVAADRIKLVDWTSGRFADADVLVLADGTLNRTSGHGPAAAQVQEFVRRGGICWILSQDPKAWTAQWLPERLRGVALVRQYGLRCVGGKAPHYVCPWLIQRHHAIFNHPHYLDEGDFSFWALTVNGEACFTAGFSALPQAPGWDVLGRYADPAIAHGALILQAAEGKGLYFWTQIFSPQIVWQQPDAQARHTWEKLLDNILTYYVSFRRDKVCRVHSESHPWSVLAGQAIAFQAQYESEAPLDRADAEVRAPDGSRNTIQLTPAGPGLLQGQYTPVQGGEHFVRITLRFGDRTAAHDHFFFKVTKGWTMYRSIAHVHLRDVNRYGTQCPGALFGAARRLGYDVIQLSPILDDGRWEDAALADNPACRFVPGCELHYRLFDRSGQLGVHGFEDLRAVGLAHYIPYPHRIPEDEGTPTVSGLIAQVHAQGGLVYGNDGAYWARQGLPLDGIEMDMGLGLSWGKPFPRYAWAPDITPVDKVNLDPQLGAWWSRQRPLWILGAVDCHGLITLLTRRSWNCVWLDKPLTVANYLAAIKAGRCAAVSRIDQVWFDIAGQPMGGTVYAVDEAPIHFRIDAGQPPRGIGVIRWPSKTPRLRPDIGDLEFNDQQYFRPEEQAYVIPPETPRLLRRVEIVSNDKVIKRYNPASRALEATFSERVQATGWYCLRAESADGCAHSNPVFVKRIDGPPGAWLWADERDLHVTSNRPRKVWEIEMSKGGILHFCLPGTTVTLAMDGQLSHYRLTPPVGRGKVVVPQSVKRVEIYWDTERRKCKY